MNEEMDEWEQYEEDGLLDLEEQLDRCLDRAFPPHSPLWHMTDEHRAACAICNPKKANRP